MGNRNAGGNARADLHWVHFGQDNEVIVVFHEQIPIPDARLKFYDKSVYP